MVVMVALWMRVQKAGVQSDGSFTRLPPPRTASLAANLRAKLMMNKTTSRLQDIVRVVQTIIESFFFFLFSTAP